MALGNTPAAGGPGKSARTHVEVRALVAGHRVRAMKREDALWLTPEQIADALGFAHARSVMTLYRRHAEELRAHAQDTVLMLGGASHRVTCFAPRALTIFACLARTKKAAAFRAALAEHVASAAWRRAAGARVDRGDFLAEAVDVLCDAFARLEPIAEQAPQGSPRHVLRGAMQAIDEHLSVIDVEHAGGPRAVAGRLPRRELREDEIGGVGALLRGLAGGGSA